MSQLLRHFGFRHHPFARQTPPDALLKHRGYEEALSRLRFAVELDAIAMLVADSGCGKSLLMGQLADELQREKWTVHYFAHSTVGPFGLVNVLARKVGLMPRRSRGETASLVIDHLLESEHRHLLVIDEAHELPDATLDDVRLLTIADFDRKSPFLLLLAGQLTLDERLAEPAHHALDQRITTVARMLPLSQDETRDYVAARLRGAGAKDTPVFDDGAVAAIAESSGGVPRRINVLATSALIVAAARKRKLVSAQDVQDAKLDRGRS
ncbi:MAG: AAA family ATPase [Chloroflexota bacterium]|nr:AAA family ATPase [Chloroflexota bacterium]